MTSALSLKNISTMYRVLGYCFLSVFKSTIFQFLLLLLTLILLPAAPLKMNSLFRVTTFVIFMIFSVAGFQKFDLNTDVFLFIYCVLTCGFMSYPTLFLEILYLFEYCFCTILFHSYY